MNDVIAWCIAVITTIVLNVACYGALAYCALWLLRHFGVI